MDFERNYLRRQKILPEISSRAGATEKRGEAVKMFLKKSIIAIALVFGMKYAFAPGIEWYRILTGMICFAYIGMLVSYYYNDKCA